MHRACLAVCVLVGTSGVIRAEPEVPRLVGRAGTGAVGDDGVGAIMTSPAALARRESRRVELGTAVVDDGVDHRPARDGSPVARSQGAPAVLPTGAAIAGVGPMVVGLGVAFDRAGRTLATPDPALSSDSIQQFFAYRYAGMRAQFERRTVGLAAAARVTDWLAVGATATLGFVRVEERRRVWAGFTSRLIDVGDPAYDVDVDVTGRDNAVPGAVFGALVAPASVPVEVAASIGWTNQIHVRGESVTAFPQQPGNLSVDLGDIRARLDIPADTAIRTGARYLADRWTLEAGFDAWIPRDRATPVWRVDGAVIRDVLTGRAEPLAMVSRFAPRRRYAARAAVDVEVVAGFLWLTAGYAFHTAGTADDHLAPSTADLGGHTAALGIEVAAGGFTASLGWSRTFATARTITTTSFALDDPFDPVPTTAGLGRYDTARDVVALSIEVSAE